MTDLEQVKEEHDEFWERHEAGGQTHVVLVIATRKDGLDDYGLFSSLERARAWTAALSEDTYAYTVTAPFVIDCPEFGNVPKGARQ